ncbi:MAG: S26 family signal peptidase [Aggregatilineales bacterium]
MPGEVPELLPSEMSPDSSIELPVPVLNQPRLKRARHRWWRDAIEMVALIVVIYSCVNLTTARAIVEGPSMQPNFYTGQLVIVNLFTYYFSLPIRGDVVHLPP